MIIFLSAMMYREQALAKDNEKQIIRVGYPIQHGFTEVTENGELSGYTYDYLMEMAKYTDWEYAFVQLEGTLDEQLTALFDMLEKGEIDLLGAMTYSDELAEIFDYPGYNYGTSYDILAVLDTNTELTVDNYYLKKDLRVAVYNSHGIENEKLNQFAKMNGIQIEQLIFPTAEEQMKALESGEADMLFTKDLIVPDDRMITIASFAQEPFYFATTKGNKKIVNELNSALLSMAKYSPNLANELKNTYFNADSKDLRFSDEEQAYIENRGVIKAVAMGGKPVMQMINEETGEYEGFSLDVLDYISKQTGLQFQVTLTDSYEEYEQIIESGAADVMIGISPKSIEIKGKDFLITDKYLETDFSMLTSNKETLKIDENSRLALPEGIALWEEYSGELIYYPTEQKCMEAVYAGEAEYCYTNIYSAQYFLNSIYYKNLVSIPQSDDWKWNLSFALVDDEDRTLLGIFNKTIHNFKEKELKELYLYNHAYQPKEETIGSFIAANKLKTVLIMSVIILLFLSIQLTISRRKDRKNEHVRQFENQRYTQISEISNEFLFEYHIKTDCLKLTGKSAEFLQIGRIKEGLSLEPEGKQPLFTFIMERKDQNEELQISLPDGKMHWVHLITKCIYDYSGEPIYTVGKIMDIQEEKEQKEFLIARAQRDTMTGLYNASAARELFAEIVGDKADETYALIMFDIDYFKQVNDTYGHYIGDFVLKNIGSILLSLFGGESKLAGRMGGDEFLILLPYGGAEAEITEKYQMLKEEVDKITFEGLQKPITLSVGVTIIKDTNKNFEVAYQQADRALYAAKDKGRNSMAMFEQL